MRNHIESTAQVTSTFQVSPFWLIADRCTGEYSHSDLSMTRLHVRCFSLVDDVLYVANDAAFTGQDDGLAKWTKRSPLRLHQSREDICYRDQLRTRGILNPTTHNTTTRNAATPMPQLSTSPCFPTPLKRLNPFLCQTRSFGALFDQPWSSGSLKYAPAPH
jgi:hypothetical protein